MVFGKRTCMVILGIDPGIATVGFGIIAAADGRYGAIEYGAVITKPHQLLETRLCEIYDAVTELIERYKPDCMAIEELFFNINLKTAVDVCHGRGVILLAAAKKQRAERAPQGPHRPALPCRLRPCGKAAGNVHDQAAARFERNAEAGRHSRRARLRHLPRQPYDAQLRAVKPR